MKNDEFAFFNQQLAAMVRDGIPLETALRRLCADMQRGPLRDELQKLEGDLAKGIPLRDAVRARQLPELYRTMLEVGAQSNDLPAVLTLLADHYQRRQLITTRLKGLMVYPVIVLIAAFLLSCFLAFLWTNLAHTVTANLFYWPTLKQAPFYLFAPWAPPLLLGVAVLAAIIILATPAIRRALRWRVPAFREASLAQVASALALMLRSGVPLPNALALVEQLEDGTPAARALAQWRQQLAGGQGKFSDMAVEGTIFPPLFLWTVSQAGEDLASGFQRAAELYQSRANYRVETLLYSALPISVLALGLIILSQFHAVVGFLVLLMNAIGDDTGIKS
jgi:type II secretory pathway component PulF